MLVRRVRRVAGAASGVIAPLMALTVRLRPADVWGRLSEGTGLVAANRSGPMMRDDDMAALVAALRRSSRRGERVRITAAGRSFAVPSETLGDIADVVAAYCDRMEPEAVSVAQAALIMGVDRDEALRRIRSGQVRAIERAGRLMALRESLPAGRS